MPNPKRSHPKKEYYTSYLPLSADEGDSAASPPEPNFTLEELVDRFIHGGEPSADVDLRVFSDLSRRDAEFVQKAWSLIPEMQRRKVIERLIELADIEFDWHLGRILRIALSDPDAQIRQIAIEGLWEDMENDLIGPLVQTLQNDPNTDVRAAAAAALGSYVLAGELDELDSALAMRAEQALLAVLQNRQEPVVVQASALESIAYSSETGVRQLIEEAYYSPEEALRISSLTAMRHSADIRWRGLARAELQNPSAAMRAEAAYTCGELEAKKSAPDLLNLLDDEVQTVRLAAIFALGRLGGKEERDALRKVASGEDAIEAEAAEDALEEMAFYASSNDGISLYEETADEEEEDNLEPWDPWSDANDEKLGEYDDE